MLADENARQQATDPHRSFIVQAPAGSGKTELLTQRYLRLLSLVTSPEQIVALTFTRKAASEMRERILLALADAEQNKPTTSAHQQLTRRYAKEALQRSQSLDWQLLNQPGRLKIITIDSLCQTLAQAIPFHEKQVPFASITDDPKALYRLAVRACIEHILSENQWHSSLKTLLLQVDNRQDKLTDLLCNLLLSRDQWLSPLFSAREQTKDVYEQALACIEEHELQRFQAAVPLALQGDLQTLSKQVACLEACSDSPRQYLRDWHSFIDMDRNIAASLAALLLTKDNKLRKSFDHHVGFKKECCSKLEYETLKNQSKCLLNALEMSPDFLDALIRVKKLPHPEYDETQWQVLQALLTLLPLLVAHLQLQFQKANALDFTAVSEQALYALGTEDAPTDLTLYLDEAIHHLLVDEFQDTSIGQFQLINKLVAGWLPHEHKTLFVVGDPMQSIYRFRQAEVGLFLRAKQQGIGSISLTPLLLRCNFRSTVTLVDWVNQHFKNVFPAEDDIQMGAVTFNPAVAQLGTIESSVIVAKQYDEKEQEAEAIVTLVIDLLETHPEDNLAILVRSRQQLSAIIPLLREKKIPFQGVEIEKLSRLAHLNDILALTKALLMPADRLSWLAFLRSPWGGIELSDLHIIANFNKKKSIFLALSHLQKIEGLSEDGVIRLRFIYEVMQVALASRHQKSLSQWLLGVIEHLHGQKILQSSARSSIEQFILLLTRFTKEGQISDFALLEDEFKRLYSQQVTQARLQIMTIHKSKGLEFDSVILPGLGSKPQQRDKPLLRWLKLPAENQDNDLLLLSPLYNPTNPCLLYDYIDDVAKDKDHYEQQRLLYVAVTRAKKRLYLFDHHQKIAQGSCRHMLQYQSFLPESLSEKIASTNELPSLSRLPLSFYQESGLDDINTQRCLLLKKNNEARIVGVVAHELLQWIGDYHPNCMEDLPWGMMTNRFRSLGLRRDEQQNALRQLYQHIQIMFTDPIGQWLIKKHDNERNEYALLINKNGKTATRIIDRTFFENNRCWVVDFKTGKDDELTQNQHRDQVNEYALLLSEFTTLPINCGLYYLSNNQWVTWGYEPL